MSVTWVLYVLLLQGDPGSQGPRGKAGPAGLRGFQGTRGLAGAMVTNRRSINTRVQTYTRASSHLQRTHPDESSSKPQLPG